MTQLVTAIFAFLGAGTGSGFAYLASRYSTKAEREARRREEWGRRFTTALTALTAPDPTVRETGRALMRELYRSELATGEDRRAADAVLFAGATELDTTLRLVRNVDEVDVVGETENDDPEGGPT